MERGTPEGATVVQVSGDRPRLRQGRCGALRGWTRLAGP